MNTQLELQYENLAQKQLSKKEYLECIKTCFICLSLNPKLPWIYNFSGHCYLQLGMYSQSRGCFNVTKDLDYNENYDQLIKLCFEKENEKKDSN